MSSGFHISLAKSHEFEVGERTFHTIPSSLRALAHVDGIQTAVKAAAENNDSTALLDVLTMLVVEGEQADFREMIQDADVGDIAKFAVWLARVMRGNPTNPTAPSSGSPGSEPSLSSPAATGSPSPDGASLPAPQTPTP